MKFRKYVPHVLTVLLAIGIAAILWLTLFSRLGFAYRHIYPPFWSYRAILKGSGKALFEDIANILLFIPIGVAAALFFKLNTKQSLLIGFTISIIIESCQWFFWLGSFEIDDLLHNTIGAGIGAVIVAHNSIGEKLKLRNWKKSFIVLIVLVVLIISSGITYQGLRWRDMKRLAALNDREDGRKNLMILSLEPSYMGKSDVNVSYNSDGSILIEGSSENRAWIQIGTMKLMPGQYVLTGLSNTEENTIALVLDAYNAEEGRYRRITQEVGAISESEFVVEEEKSVRALISIYPGNAYSVIARPAVFRTE